MFKPISHTRCVIKSKRQFFPDTLRIFYLPTRTYPRCDADRDSELYKQNSAYLILMSLAKSSMYEWRDSYLRPTTLESHHDLQLISATQITPLKCRHYITGHSFSLP